MAKRNPRNETEPKKTSTCTDEMVEALLDPRVGEVIGRIVEDKLRALMNRVADLERGREKSVEVQKARDGERRAASAAGRP